MIPANLDCDYFAYIDEAGEHGDQYGAGSTHFIAMAAAILPAWNPTLPEQLFEHARALANRDNQFKKFSERRMRDRDRYVLTQLFSFYGVQVVQVAFYKPSLGGNWFSQDCRREYNYLIKFTIERISWAVRDRTTHQHLHGGRCHLVFSESKMLKYDKIRAYLRRLREGKGAYNCSAEWRFIDPHFSVSPHENETGTHLGDIAASAFHQAIEPKSNGMTDDRFQRNLGDAIYRRSGKPYGLKLFPESAISFRRTLGEFDFLRLL